MIRIIESVSEEVEPFRAGECWVRFKKLAGEWHCYVCDETTPTTRVLATGLGSGTREALFDAHRRLIRVERVTSGAVSALGRLLEES